MASLMDEEVAEGLVALKVYSQVVSTVALTAVSTVAVMAVEWVAYLADDWAGETESLLEFEQAVLMVGVSVGEMVVVRVDKQDDGMELEMEIQLGLRKVDLQVAALDLWRAQKKVDEQDILMELQQEYRSDDQLVIALEHELAAAKAHVKVALMAALSETEQVVLWVLGLVALTAALTVVSSVWQTAFREAAWMVASMDSSMVAHQDIDWVFLKAGHLVKRTAVMMDSKDLHLAAQMVVHSEQRRVLSLAVKKDRVDFLLLLLKRKRISTPGTLLKLKIF